MAAGGIGNGCGCDENGFCCGNGIGIGIGSCGFAIGGCGIGIGSDGCGTAFGSAGRDCAATAAEPHELATTGGALPIGDIDGGVLAIGALRCELAIGGFAFAALDLAAVGTGGLNSTGSEEIARGFANGMTLVGAGVTAADRIEGIGAPERATVVAGEAGFFVRGGGTLRASTVVTSPMS